MSGPSRRGSFGLAAFIMGAPAALVAVTSPPPDAELIAIGREAAPLIAAYEQSIAKWFALPKGHPDSQKSADAGDAPFERLDVLTARALELDATTLEGFQAKARLLIHHLRCYSRMDGKVTLGTEEDMLGWSLAHDLLGGAA